MIVELLISIFSILLMFHIYTRYSRRGRLLDRLPGPMPFPIVGNLLMFDVNSSYELWRVLRRCVKKYYPISKFWGFYAAVVNVHHPDDLEVLLSCQKDIGKNYFYNYLRTWIGSGLLTTPGEKWLDRRKILSPPLHAKMIGAFFDVINDQSKKLIEAIEFGDREMKRNLVPLCSDFTLDIIVESTTGVDLKRFTLNTAHQYRNAIHQMRSIIGYRLVKPYVYEWMIPFVPKMKITEKSARRIIECFSEELVNERRQYHIQTDYKYPNDDSEDVPERDKDNEEKVENVVSKEDDRDLGRRFAILDQLLKAEKDGSINNTGILEEINTMIFAGHEPIATAMVFTLLLFAENRVTQDKARAEVTRVFDEKDGEISMEEIREFHYLERCIKESMRLYPPIPNLLRYTPEELQLKNGLIPANTHMIIHLWDTHRDSNFWPNPHKFDPDRFLLENTKNRHPFAYIPFSAEPRNCIGESFAMMELKLLISRILYNYYLEPVDRTETLKLAADVVLHPKEPVRVKFTRVKKNEGAESV